MEGKIREYIDKLNYYTKLYDEGNPAVSDAEWDSMYYQLQIWENMYNIYYADSPTQSISYTTVNELTKVKHNHPMLSLDKTKDWDEFKNYFNNIDSSKNVIAMLKLDGLTCSLKYVDGRLVSAETRGNGEIGEDILHNALVVKNIPNKINYTDELIIDGEIICTYADFESFKEDYKNPRNFASGSIRLLDAEECANRNLTFVVWNVIAGFEDTNSFSKKLTKAEELGFTTTPWVSGLELDVKEYLLHKAKHLYPIDGLVARFDDINFGAELGSTAHHARAAYAFKFYDEEYETELIDIEWSMGRTGQITPIALFEKVYIDGTEVSRASLSNVSIMEKTLGKNPFKRQKIYISKRNMIIPKIEKAKDENDQWI